MRKITNDTQQFSKLLFIRTNPAKVGDLEKSQQKKKRKRGSQKEELIRWEQCKQHYDHTEEMLEEQLQLEKDFVCKMRKTRNEQVLFMIMPVEHENHIQLTDKWSYRVYGTVGRKERKEQRFLKNVLEGEEVVAEVGDITILSWSQCHATGEPIGVVSEEDDALVAARNLRYHISLAHEEKYLSPTETTDRDVTAIEERMKERKMAAKRQKEKREGDIMKMDSAEL